MGPASAILAIIRGLLELSGMIARYARDKQLMDAGEAKAIAATIDAGLRATARAAKIRRGVAALPDSDIDRILRGDIPATAESGRSKLPTVPPDHPNAR